MSAHLEVSGVSLAFGGLKALDDCSFTVPKGRVTCLSGPNGAGKTTVFDVITGFLRPDAGGVAFRGRPLNGLSPAARVSAGIARTFQDLRLFAEMSVRDNVVACLPEAADSGLTASLLRPVRAHRGLRARQARAAEILDGVGLGHKIDDAVTSLSYGQQKLLCIARVLATGAEMLLLDEPTSGLSQQALHDMVAAVERLKASGHTLLIVEHNTRMVTRIADEIVFLHRGHALRQGSPQAILSDPELAEIYFGGVTGTAR